MKYAIYYVDYMVYATFLGKSLLVAFGKGFLGFCKIFTPACNPIFEGEGPKLYFKIQSLSKLYTFDLSSISAWAKASTVFVFLCSV